MAIAILDESISPDELAQGDHNVRLSFTGISDDDNDSITVDFIIEDVAAPIFFIDNIGNQLKKISFNKTFTTSQTSFQEAIKVSVNHTPRAKTAVRLLLKGVNNKGSWDARIMAIFYQ